MLALYAITRASEADPGRMPAIPGSQFTALDGAQPGLAAWDGWVETPAGDRPALWIERQVEKDQPWLGSSDIIESVFGKYKNFSARTPMKDVGKSVLSIPVFTSDVTLSEVKEAMENVSMRDLRGWLAENVGDTLLARRKRAFNYLETKKPVKKKAIKLPKAAGF